LFGDSCVRWDAIPKLRVALLPCGSRNHARLRLAAEVHADFSDEQSATVQTFMTPSTLDATRLLVVTANRPIYQRLADLLAGLDYAMQHIEDASEASRILLDDNPPEIVLIDERLPGQSGLELAAEIKHRNPQKRTWTILLLTSSADPETIALAVDAGIDDLLLCPAGEAIGEIDLRVRLGVATRVLDHIHHLEAQVQATSQQSLRDALTGLWNRESILSLLFAETDRVQRMGTQLSFLLLDLDNFARINAEYGYDTGDKILHEVAVRLRRYMRSYDLLGRTGEDEFLIALPGCNAYQARHLADRILTIMLRNPFAAADGKIRVTASIGLAQSRGRTPLVVLREAAQSLASAKREKSKSGRELPPAHKEQALLENNPA